MTKKQHGVHMVSWLVDAGVPFDTAFVALNSVSSYGNAGDKPEAINVVCGALLSELDNAQRLEDQGETHLVRRGLTLPISAIRKAAYDMLEACRSANIAPTEGLCELTRRAMDVPEWSIATENTFEFGMCVLLSVARPGLSTRKIEGFTGVDHSTIARWQKSDAFKRAASLVASPENAERILRMNLEEQTARRILD